MLERRVPIILGRDNTSKKVRDRPSKDTTLKGMNNGWEGEICGSSFEMSSEMYVGAVGSR